MIWDAIILRPRDSRGQAAGLALADCLPLGPLEAVTSAVRAAFPAATWRFPTGAEFQLDGTTVMQIDLGYVETSHTIHIAVTGPGNPLPRLFSLASANGWAVLEVCSREFIELRSVGSPGDAGYETLWQQLRRRAAMGEG